jgi:queuine tRNA-ribosyltransferase
VSRFFTVEAIDGAARAGLMSFNKITVETPYFQPIATRGIIKDGRFEDAERIGYPLLLMNTYHLLCRPGSEVIREIGGLKKFTGWTGGILTDSGGFQIFSLSPLREVTWEGVRFRDYESGKPFSLTPEDAVEVQLGCKSDLAMALDVCSRLPAERNRLKHDLKTTHQWAQRACEHWKSRGGARTRTRLFGIVQGGTELDLRAESIETIANLGFPGIAVGGLSVGETRGEFVRTAKFCAENLPDDRPRYLMGVGTPYDIVQAVEMGYDLFDCVLPTRMARRGTVYTWEGVLNLKLKKFRLDTAPPSPSCRCAVCQRYSRAFLRHLMVSDELSGAILLTYHNLYFYHDLMRRLRRAIAGGKLAQFTSRHHQALRRKL